MPCCALQPGHAWLAQHYKYGLERTFTELAHSHVIILEDDMVRSHPIPHDANLPATTIRISTVYVHLRMSPVSPLHVSRLVITMMPCNGVFEPSWTAHKVYAHGHLQHACAWLLEIDGKYSRIWRNPSLWPPTGLLARLPALLRGDGSSS